MKKVDLDYEISESTMAILQVADEKYQTLILDVNGDVYTSKIPLALLEEACIRGGASYAGRIRATVHVTGIKQKVPAIINEHQGIAAFPTHSPSNVECVWLFSHHIRDMKAVGSKSAVQFTNGQWLVLEISYETLKRQLHRTSYCIMCFNHLAKT